MEEDFPWNNRFLKLVCWTNVIFALPHFYFAVNKLFRFTNPANLDSFHKNLQYGSHALTEKALRTLELSEMLMTLLFILFHVALIYGLIRYRRWSRSLIFLDAISGYMVILVVGLAGPISLKLMPSSMFYENLLYLGENIHASNVLPLLLLGKGIINSFNILYFSGFFSLNHVLKRTFSYMATLAIVGLIGTIIITFFQIYFYPATRSHVFETRTAELAGQYLEGLVYNILAYKGKDTDYILTKEILISMPYIEQWSVQSVNPCDYLGRHIIVEKFVVKNYPLFQRKNRDIFQNQMKIVVFVMTTNSKVIGGYFYPVNDYLVSCPRYGTWPVSLGGRTFGEIHPNFPNFSEWLKSWEKRCK
jgi:hypothetical protein